jgi:hypothetical protein
MRKAEQIEQNAAYGRWRSYPTAPLRLLGTLDDQGFRSFTGGSDTAAMMRATIIGREGWALDIEAGISVTENRIMRCEDHRCSWSTPVQGRRRWRWLPYGMAS